MSCNQEQMIARLDASITPASPLEVVCNATQIGERETFVVETFVYSWVLGFEKTNVLYFLLAFLNWSILSLP